MSFSLSFYYHVIFSSFWRIYVLWLFRTECPPVLQEAPLSQNQILSNLKPPELTEPPVSGMFTRKFTKTTYILRSTFTLVLSLSRFPIQHVFGSFSWTLNWLLIATHYYETELINHTKRDSKKAWFIEISTLNQSKAWRTTR